MSKTRFEEKYEKTIRPALAKELGIENVMAIPKISKVVVNVGVKEAVADSRVVQKVVDIIDRIVGQKSVQTKAKKSIASFKVREGMALGVRVTLRRKNMYEFLDRLISLALPNVRDFQGVNTKFDGQGNYNLGVKDWIIFPEVEFGALDKSQGMNITIHTTARDDKAAYALLKQFGMPFKEMKK
jgi:large subunit ribosomal protein L5